MILDFSFDQVMRLSSIKRWGIIEMSRCQSVAEHSYNVAMITMSLADKLSKKTTLPPYFLEASVNWALMHDLPEIVTGDIPSSFKREINDAVDSAEHSMFPDHSSHKHRISPEVKILVKVADFMDAIQFAEKYCIDSRKKEVIDELRVGLGIAVGRSSMSDHLAHAVDDLETDYGPKRKFL